MKTFENYCSSIGLVTVLSVTSLALVPNVSNAQEEEAAEIEEVIVTGSRIKRPAQDAAVPIMEYLNDDITTSSDIDLSRMIRDLPNIYQGTSTENSQSNPVDSGIATVELRNLGSDRTLVLIDGKRTVTNSLKQQLRQPRHHSHRLHREGRSHDGWGVCRLWLRCRRGRREYRDPGLLRGRRGRYKGRVVAEFGR